ncbi:translation initiation factor IF-2-like [Oxyura jamaicensis]|uniref:translation initiation factor IF-2-like n=1 Tax=Oxyura jamaicensis TaxID=8884 RepID=UPI0015A55383|nr:translation initiation factor IF-2-like [Oxyura jamaicensis]
MGHVGRGGGQRRGARVLWGRRGAAVGPCPPWGRATGIPLVLNCPGRELTTSRTRPRGPPAVGRPTPLPPPPPTAPQQTLVGPGAASPAFNAAGVLYNGAGGLPHGGRPTLGGQPQPHAAGGEPRVWGWGQARRGAGLAVGLGLPWGRARRGAEPAVGLSQLWGRAHHGAGLAVGLGLPWGRASRGAEPAVGLGSPWGWACRGAGLAVGQSQPWGRASHGAEPAVGLSPPWGSLRGRDLAGGDGGDLGGLRGARDVVLVPEGAPPAEHQLQHARAELRAARPIATARPTAPRPTAPQPIEVP